jgi:hypothetical protein
MADVLLSGLTESQPGVSIPINRWSESTILTTFFVDKQRTGSGDIGFIKEGGLITVVADAAKIDVSFDRAMIYNGSFTPVPGGVPYSIAQPTLDSPTARILSIPIINVGTPKIVTAKANANGIDLAFDKAVDLAATPDYGTMVNNLRVNTATPLSTTEVQLFTSVSSNTYEWLSTPQTVTGVGVLPYVVTAYARDNTSFVLIFSEDVTESSATNPANYVITPALDIVSIVKLNSTTYAMNTSQQTANTAYHITLTGVIDRANNPI